MTRVVVYVSDFELGTRIADTVTVLEKEAIFPPQWEIGDGSLYDDAILVIVDLNEEKQKPFELVKRIRETCPELHVAGIVSRLQKEVHSRAKAAGCTWILPRSSFVRNLSTFLESGGAEPD